MQRLAMMAMIKVASVNVTAWAALPVGRAAPNFQTMGALDGKPFRLHLGEQLKYGPVVLYSYSKDFTPGLTLETRAFLEASADFAAPGARVIGLSANNLRTLKHFSVEHCRGKFPVATAAPAIISAYDVKLPVVRMTNRPSYVIARDGRIAIVHSDLD